MLAIPDGFIFQLAAEFRPPRLGDAPGQGTVVHHPGHVQVFETHRVEPPDEVRGQLVQEVQAPIGHPLVQPSDLATDLLPVLRPFGLPRQLPFQPLQALEFLLQPMRVRNLLARRERQVVLQTADARPVIGIPCAED